MSSINNNANSKEKSGSVVKNRILIFSSILIPVVLLTFVLTLPSISLAIARLNGEDLSKNIYGYNPDGPIMDPLYIHMLASCLLAIVSSLLSVFIALNKNKKINVFDGIFAVCVAGFLYSIIKVVLTVLF